MIHQTIIPVISDMKTLQRFLKQSLTWSILLRIFYNSYMRMKKRLSFIWI